MLPSPSEIGGLGARLLVIKCDIYQKANDDLVTIAKGKGVGGSLAGSTPSYIVGPGTFLKLFWQALGPS